MNLPIAFLTALLLLPTTAAAATKSARVAAPVPAPKISREFIVSQGKKRTYYLYVPGSTKPETPAPLVVLLHGSGRDGLSLAEPWKDLAEREGFILAAPNSADSKSWATPIDGPDFLHELVESLRSRFSINARRIYLFGHSAGAIFALHMSMYESEYFAATAVHAGALAPDSGSLIALAKRKTPISIQVGTNDPLFPLAAVRATRDLLDKQGFAAELTEIPNHTHWYYDRAQEINAAAWDFLKRHELAADPRFEAHRFGANDKVAKRERAALEAYNRGVRLHQAGDAAGAIEAYTRALELDPSFADALTNRGSARLSRNDYAAAVADLTRAIELKPSEVAYNNRGNAFRLLKKPQEAVSDYTRAAELAPRSAMTYFNRAVVRNEQGDTAAALADYTRAIELDPRLAAAYAYRGVILLQQGRDAEAGRDLDTAFELDPKLKAELGTYIDQLRASRKRGN